MRVEPIERLDRLLNRFEVVKYQEQRAELAVAETCGEVLFSFEACLVPARRLEQLGELFGHISRRESRRPDDSWSLLEKVDVTRAEPNDSNEPLRFLGDEV